MKLYKYLQKQKIAKVAILTVWMASVLQEEKTKLQSKEFGMQITSDETYGPKDDDMRFS